MLMHRWNRNVTFTPGWLSRATTDTGGCSGANQAMSWEMRIQRPISLLCVCFLSWRIKRTHQMGAFKYKRARRREKKQRPRGRRANDWNEQNQSKSIQQLDKTHGHWANSWATGARSWREKSIPLGWGRIHLRRPVRMVAASPGHLC